ncbi:MAG: twin-arginine translocase TatA/TatE family subunit [Galactobacter sp.]
MFGINGSELIVLALVAMVVLGPEKLPGYTRQLTQLIKKLRGFADTAKERLREEGGDELADVDWRKLDPRQYDPRKIIRDALFDDDMPDAPSTASAGTSASGTSGPGGAGAAGAAGAAAAGMAAATRPDLDHDRLPPGTPAPFDDEAT